MTVATPIKWFGGKHYLAKRIVELMPPRCKNPNKPDQADPGYLHYVEPYAGGLSVLLANDPEGISEVVNDLNKDLVNFWKTLQGRDSFSEFKRICETTPFAESEWKDADVEFAEWPEPCEAASDSIVRAWKFFIRCRQSLAGRMKGFSGITRTRTRRGMNNEVSAWLSCIEGLPAVHERLKRVLIVGPKEATDVISKEDGPRTLFYLDCPYLHSVRASKDVYAHEMTDDQHEKLLGLLVNIKGRFLLSGYHSILYDEMATLYGWKCHEFNIANHSAGGKEKRRMTECVWINY